MHGHKTSHLPIRYFLPFLWAHTILHISSIRVKGRVAEEMTDVSCKLSHQHEIDYLKGEHSLYNS